jgi:hypothetical protein
MDTFSIKIKDPAEERLKKYDKNIQILFANTIRKLKENPEIYGKPNENRFTDTGNYILRKNSGSITPLTGPVTSCISKQFITGMNVKSRVPGQVLQNRGI